MHHQRHFVICFFVFTTLVTIVSPPTTAIGQNSEAISYSRQTVLGRGPASETRWSPDGRQIAVITPFDIWIYTSQLEDVLHLPNHPAHIASVAWSPDSSMIACVRGQGGLYFGYEVIVWNATSSEILFEYQNELAQSQGTATLAWKSDNRQLALGTGEGEILIWEVPTGETVARLNTVPVSSLQWSRDGNALLSLHRFDSALRVWDQSTFTVSQVISYPKNSLQDAVWNPNGELFASRGPKNGTLNLGSIENGTFLATFNTQNDGTYPAPFSGSIIALDWNRTGDRIAIAWDINRDHSMLQIWDAQTGEIVPVFANTEGTSIQHMAWSPDNSRFAITRSNGTIELRDATSGELLRVNYQHPARLSQLAWSSDGSRIATLGSGGRIWDVATGQVLIYFSDQDAKSLLQQSENDQIVFYEEVGDIYHTESCRWLTQAPTADQALNPLWSGDETQCPAALSPALTYLAYIDHRGEDQTTIVITDLATGMELASMDIDNWHGMAWADHVPELFIHSGYDVLIWNVETGTSRVVEEVYPGTLIPSPDGRWLINSKTFKEEGWDTAASLKQFEFFRDTYIAPAAAWHPNNQLLAVNTQEGIGIRDMVSGDVLTTIPEHVNELAWNQDGTQLAGLIDAYKRPGDGTIVIWQQN